MLPLGCSREPSATNDPPAGQTRAAPIGETAYTRLLEERSGSAVAPADLAGAASSAEQAIEARLEHLAEKIRPGAGWREVFADLRLEHPTDAAEVLATYRQEVERAAAFVARQDFVTLPPSLPDVVEGRNRLIRESFPLALYMGGSLAVTLSPGQEPAPAYLANHCRVCIPPLAVHEAYPGHHVAFYHSSIANAGLEPGQPVEIRTRPPLPFFHEGWGLYSELLMLDHGYYGGDPARELGAWRMLLLRALRARVDAMLHGGALDATGAATLYQERLLTGADAARAEVRRHLADPANKASYFVGLLQILELRRLAHEADPPLTLKEFHNRLLRRPGPIPEIARSEFGVELDGLGGFDFESGRMLTAVGRTG